MKRIPIRVGIAATIVIVASLMLPGCTARSEDSGASGPAIGAPGIATDEDLGSGFGGDSSIEDGRQVISTGAMVITADDPIRAAGDAVQIVEDAGGRIDSRSEQPAQDAETRLAGSSDLGSTDSSIYPGPGLPAPSAQLVVRIPSAKLTATLDEIKELGSVESVAISANDVTAQSEDLDSRITALQTSVDRLVGLLAGATTTKDLIDIETALSVRQAELESLLSQQRSLSDQVDLSTISITFGSVESAPVERPSDFFSGIGAGWQTLVAFTGGVLVTLGFLLPWLLVLAVLGAITFLVVRGQKRRRRAAFLATEEPMPAEPPAPHSEAPSATSEKSSTTME